jgi:hypothetical protein
MRSFVFLTLAALVLTLAGTGCSQPSDNNPKAPENAPTLKKMIPSAGGGKGKTVAPNQAPKSE